MGSSLHERAFTFDVATMEDEVIAPEDEMRGMAIKIPRHRTKPSPPEPQKQQEQQQQRSPSNNNDDENRIPPPAMETVVPSGITNSSSSHPNFDAWKQHMTENILSGTKPTNPSKKKAVHTDWKTTRLNKRRLEKKLLHQQLRRIKSDSSTKSESESSNEYTADEEQRSSIESSGSSSRPVKCGNKRRNRRNSRQRRGRHSIHTVYVRKDTSVPMSPRSQALERPTMSLVETPVSPRPNSRELVDIQNELADLKCWAEESKCPTSPTKTHLRQSTPPSSPTSPKPPVSRIFTPSPEKKERQRSKGSQESKSNTVPRSIVVPQLAPTPALHGKKYKHLIEKEQISGKGMGIPAVLTITTVTTPTTSPKYSNKSKTAKEKKKKVRFNKPLITDTVYRPKTPREEIDTLYFQEEELIDWEIDEETTAPDRFEVVVSNFCSKDGCDSTYSGTISFGAPEIFFHDSFSSSCMSSSDEEDKN